jgi:hypothetical protein
MQYRGVAANQVAVICFDSAAFAILALLTLIVLYVNAEFIIKSVINNFIRHH